MFAVKTHEYRNATDHAMDVREKAIDALIDLYLTQAKQCVDCYFAAVADALGELVDADLAFAEAFEAEYETDKAR